VQSNNLSGILTCARYSFAPNYYKYCGPDANKKISSYLQNSHADPNLVEILDQFDVLFRYLSLIAHSNNIADPFDQRVVEAYWIGNSLLEKVKPTQLGNHLLYDQQLKKRLPPKMLKWVVEKIPKGVKVHHSFHVFNIFIRTGHLIAPHTVDTMDQCRIGWGKVIKVHSSQFTVHSQKLISQNKKLVFIDSVRELSTPIDRSIKNKLKPGDLVSFHWGFICDKITPQQAKNLAFYTNQNLKLANETI